MSGVLWSWRRESYDHPVTCDRCGRTVPAGEVVIGHFELGRRCGDGLGDSPQRVTCDHTWKGPGSRCESPGVRTHGDGAQNRSQGHVRPNGGRS